MPMETSPLISGIDHTSNVNGKNSSITADVQTLQEVTNRYKAVQVDPAEFACLKAIVLFKPGESPTLLASPRPRS